MATLPAPRLNCGKEKEIFLCKVEASEALSKADDLRRWTGVEIR
jgi:hypothetical protein